MSKSKEEIKALAERVAVGFGYAPYSANLDVINVRDAFCIGYTEGSKDVAYPLTQQESEDELWMEVFEIFNAHYPMNAKEICKQKFNPPTRKQPQ